MKPQILVVAGPTSAGKSRLGEALALAYKGDIISADSRQVFRGLDLGTGKEKLKVPQRLIDICDPEERFTAADWRARAEREIDLILANGRLPIIVGGTGLYISSLIENYSFAPEGDDQLRAELAADSVEELVAELEKTNPAALAGLDQRNRRYVERAVEKTRLGWTEASQGETPYDALVLVPDWPREELYARIDQRLDDRLAAGLLAEVEGLIKQGVDPEWLKRLGLEYRYLTDYLDGRYKTLEDVKVKLKYAIHHYARRQLIWWRHRPCQMVPRADWPTAKRLVDDWRRDSI